MKSLKEGDSATALKLLNQLESSSRRKAMQGKLVLYQKLGDNQKIVETIDQLGKMGPLDPGLKIEKAIALRNLGERERAEALLKGFDINQLNNPDHLIAYGRYQLFKKDYPEAKRAFARALDLAPGNEDALLGYAYYHVWMKDDDKAQRWVNKLLEKNPGNVDGLILKGWLMAWNEFFPQAIVSFQGALSIAPNHPEALRGLAQSYAWDGQYSQSIAYFEQLLTIQAENVDVFLQYGRVLQKAGKYGEAIQVLTQASVLDPERVDVREELALARRWVEEVDSNIRTLRRQIALNQGDTKNFITLGQTFNWLGQLKESKEVYEAALEKDPQNVQLLYGLAKVHQGLNHLEEAKKLLKKVLEIKPEFLDARFLLDQIKDQMSPIFLLQYSYTKSIAFDPFFEQTGTTTQTNFFTTEYSQRLHSRYTLKMGYSFSLSTEDDKIFEVTNSSILHQIVYLQSDMQLPFNINLYLRYDVNIFSNRGDNFFNLPDRKFKHGGFVLVEVPYRINNFSFEFSRNFFTVFPFDVEVGRSHSLTFSDNVSWTDYFSTLFSFSTSHNTLSDMWGRSYVVRPRLVMPYFTPLTLEYEYAFMESPNSQTHKFIPKFVGEFAQRFQWEAGYTLTYFTVGNDVSHGAQLLLVWTPTDHFGVTLIGGVDYFKKDWTQNYIASTNIKF